VLSTSNRKESVVMSNNKSRKSSEVERMLSKIKLGAQTVLAGGKTLPARATVYDQATLIQTADGHLALYKAVHDLVINLKKGRADRDANEPNTEVFIAQIRAAVANAYGEDSTEFADFGFAPRKKPVELTSEQKKLQVARAQATRAARHTLGSRARKAVKGVVNPPEGGNATGSTPANTGKP
jgi:hypothetical protein